MNHIRPIDYFDNLSQSCLIHIKYTDTNDLIRSTSYTITRELINVYAASNFPLQINKAATLGKSLVLMVPGDRPSMTLNGGGGTLNLCTLQHGPVHTWLDEAPSQGRHVWSRLAVSKPFLSITATRDVHSWFKC